MRNAVSPGFTWENVLRVLSSMATSIKLLRASVRKTKKKSARDAAVVRVNELLQPRIDLRFPPSPAEDAVMPDAWLHVMFFHVWPDAGAQVMRRERLSDRADVVFLAFDGEQRRAADSAGLNQPAA